MIDYENIILEIDKCIEKVNLDLSLCKLHLTKRNIDLSFEYLVDAQRDIRLIEEFYP